MYGWSQSLLLAGLLVLVTPGAVAANRFSIHREQVLALLRLSDEGLLLLMPNAISRVGSPQLKVISENHEGSSLRLRIGCLRISECLPFYVVVQFRSSEAAARFAKTVACATRSAIHANPDPVLVRPGEMAHLEVALSDQITLRIDVRCLQAGKLQQVIPVRDEETRKLYSALVLGRGELRAHL